MEKEKQLEDEIEMMVRQAEILSGEDFIEPLRTTFKKILIGFKKQARKELIEEFEKMIGKEIILMKDCKSEAVKSQNNSQFESNNWYREQGEKYAYEVGIITLKRIIKQLQELKEKK